MRRGFSGDAASGSTASAFMLVILALVVVAWAGVKSTELVTRMTVAHPTNWLLRLGLLLALLAAVGVALTSGQVLGLNLLAALSLLVLVLVARVVELHHDARFQLKGGVPDLLAALR